MASSLHKALAANPTDPNLQNLHVLGYVVADLTALAAITTAQEGMGAFVQSPASFYVRTASTWEKVGGGEVSGPASSQVDQVAVFQDTTGKVIKATLVTIDTSGNVALVESIKFNALVTPPAHAAGKTWYDDVEKCLSYYNDDPDVSNQVGQELWVRVYNNTGATILNGKAVYVNGAFGGFPTVALAKADALGTSNAIGLATHDIENGTFGFVTSMGIVRDVDTSAFSDGAVLYLSAATAGALTATEPVPPNQRVIVGVVGLTHATTGRINVDISFLRTNGDVTGPASSIDNELPRFDGTTGKALQGSGVVVDDNGVFNNKTGQPFRVTPTDQDFVVDFLGASAGNAYIRRAGANKWIFGNDGGTHFYFEIVDGYMQFKAVGAPAAPGVTGYVRLYVKTGTDDEIFLKGFGGTERKVLHAGDLATTTEVLTGTSTAKAVTPDALAALWEQGANVASAATVSFGEGGFFHVTGTTTITDIDFDTDKAGRPALVAFDGVLTLTHGANLILPTSANITTQAGDRALFVSEGTDVVRCLFYQRADGTALVGGATLASTTEVLTGTDTAKAVTPDALAALWEQGANVASAATVSFGEGGFFHVTGTTTITDIDFDTDKAGRPALVAFDGVLTLTHGANLILPTSANIVTQAGDRALFVSEGTDVVRCLFYQRADGTALVGSATLASTTEVLTGTDAAKAVTPDALAALWEQGSNVASAATISLGEGGLFHVTGTTTITDIDFATDKAGRSAVLVFDGSLTLTDGANLILPTGENIQTAAGDCARFVSEGSDVVRCVSYTRANGRALVHQYTFYADQFSDPVTSNWAVNALAPVVADPTNSGLKVRQFGDSSETGLGFEVKIPDGASSVRFTLTHRAQTAPGTSQTIQWALYVREQADNAALEAWSAATDMTVFTIPTNANFQVESQVIALSTLSLVAGRFLQVELTRQPADANDTLTGNLLLLELVVEFF